MATDIWDTSLTAPEAVGGNIFADTWEEEGEGVYFGDRGVMGDIASMVGRAGVSTLETLENAAEFFNLNDSTVDSASKLRQFSFFQPDMDEALDQGWLQDTWAGSIPEAFESMGPSLATAGAGVATGWMLSGGNPIGGVIGGVLASMGIMGTSEYQQTYEGAIESGLTEDEATTLAWKVGAIEGLGESVGTLIGVSPLVKPFTALVKKPVIESLEQLMKFDVKQAAKGLFATYVGEQATEIGQSVSQTHFLREAGMTNISNTEAALKTIIPTLFMTGAFRAGTGALNTVQRAKIENALQNTENTTEAKTQRLTAAIAVENMLKRKSPEVAEQWRTIATHKIENNEEIKFDAKFSKLAEEIETAHKKPISEADITSGNVTDAQLQAELDTQKDLEDFADFEGKITEATTMFHPLTGDPEFRPVTGEEITPETSQFRDRGPQLALPETTEEAPAPVEEPVAEPEKVTPIERMSWAELRKTAKEKGINIKGKNRATLEDELILAEGGIPKRRLADMSYKELQAHAKLIGISVVNLKRADLAKKILKWRGDKAIQLGYEPVAETVEEQVAPAEEDIQREIQTTPEPQPPAEPEMLPVKDKEGKPIVENIAANNEAQNKYALQVKKYQADIAEWRGQQAAAPLMGVEPGGPTEQEQIAIEEQQARKAAVQEEIGETEEAEILGEPGVQIDVRTGRRQGKMEAAPDTGLAESSKTNWKQDLTQDTKGSHTGVIEGTVTGDPNTFYFIMRTKGQGQQDRWVLFVQNQEEKPVVLQDAPADPQGRKELFRYAENHAQGTGTRTWQKRIPRDADGKRSGPTTWHISPEAGYSFEILVKGGGNFEVTATDNTSGESFKVEKTEGETNWYVREGGGVSVIKSAIESKFGFVGEDTAQERETDQAYEDLEEGKEDRPSRRPQLVSALEGILKYEAVGVEKTPSSMSIQKKADSGQLKGKTKLKDLTRLEMTEKDIEKTMKDRKLNRKQAIEYLEENPMGATQKLSAPRKGSAADKYIGMKMGGKVSSLYRRIVAERKRLIDQLTQLDIRDEKGSQEQKSKLMGDIAALDGVLKRWKNGETITVGETEAPKQKKAKKTEKAKPGQREPGAAKTVKQEAKETKAKVKKTAEEIKKKGAVAPGKTERSAAEKADLAKEKKAAEKSAQPSTTKKVVGAPKRTAPETPLLEPEIQEGEEKAVKLAKSNIKKLAVNAVQTVTMSAKEFLGLSTSGQKTIDRIKKEGFVELPSGKGEYAEGDAAAMKFDPKVSKKAANPYLIINKDGRVTGHDGRHRAVFGGGNMNVTLIFEGDAMPANVLLPQFKGGENTIIAAPVVTKYQTVSKKERTSRATKEKARKGDKKAQRREKFNKYQAEEYKKITTALGRELSSEPGSGSTQKGANDLFWQLAKTQDAEDRSKRQYTYAPLRGLVEVTQEELSEVDLFNMYTKMEFDVDNPVDHRGDPLPAERTPEGGIIHYGPQWKDENSDVPPETNALEILQNAKDPLSKALLKVLDHKVLAGIPVVHDPNANGSHYDGREGRGYIVLKGNNQDIKVHEAIHAALSHKLEASPELMAEVEALRIEYEKLLYEKGILGLKSDYDAAEPYAYAAYSAQEFLAEAAGDPRVRKLMGGGFWNRLWRAFRKAIGLPSTQQTMFERVMDVSQRIAKSEAQVTLDTLLRGPDQTTKETAEQTWERRDENILKNEPELDVIGKNKEGFQKFVDEAWRLFKEGVEITSRKLHKISPMAADQMRKAEFWASTHNKKYRDMAEPFFKKFRKLGRKDSARLKYMLINANTTDEYTGKKFIELAEDLMKEKGMLREWKAIEAINKEITQDAINAGISIRRLNNYVPRFVTDITGLVDWFNNRATEKQKKQLQLGTIIKGKATETQMAELIDLAMRNGIKGVPLPGSMKQRTVGIVPSDAIQFYGNIEEAMMNHIYSMNEHVAFNRVLGNAVQKKADKIKESHAVQKEIEQLEDKETAEAKAKVAKLRDKLQTMEEEIDEMDKTDWETSLTNKMVEEGMNQTDRDAIVKLFNNRYKERGTTGAVRALKNIGLMATLGNIVSAVTQLGDLALVVYYAGPTNAMSGIMKALSGRELTEELDLETQMREFAAGDSTEILGRILKVSGFQWVDLFGKEAFLQAQKKRYSKMGKDQFMKKWKDYLTDPEGAYEDFQAGKIKSGSDAMYVLFSELSGAQPITLSETPPAYQVSGNWRILWMLKTFAIKQLNSAVTEFEKEYEQGNKVKAVRNTFTFLMLLTTAGAGADEIKDLMMGRKKDITDHMMDNLWQFALLSKFSVEKGLERDQLFNQIMQGQLPPVGIFDDIVADIRDTFNGEGPKGKSLRNIPIGGRIWYDRVMTGGIVSELNRQRTDILEDIEDGKMNRSEINAWNRKARKYKDDLDLITSRSITSARKRGRE